MKNTRILCIILSLLLVASSFAACTSKDVFKRERVKEKASESATAEVSDTTAATVSETTAAQDTTAVSVTAVGTTASGNKGTAGKTGNTGKKNNSSSTKGKTTAKKAEKKYIDIVLLPNGDADCKSPNVTLSTNEILINKAGDYKISSKTKSKPWHGQIIVKLPNTAKAEIRFENVNIQYNTKNIIQIFDTSVKSKRAFLEVEGVMGEAQDDEIKAVADSDKAPNVDITFPTKTTSTFTSTAKSSTGILYNESKLTIKGNGTANFDSTKNTNNCICSTKSIKIKNLNLNLTTAQNANTSAIDKAQGSAKGIFSYSRVTVESGKLNIKSNGDAVRCDEFQSLGGTSTIKSSACDAIDADDAIVISGGTVKATALEKSSFKVRRINNTENGIKNKGVRKGKNDTFQINGGTVIGESKKLTTVQPSSKQAVISCKIVKPSRGTEAAAQESKVPAVIEITGLKKSASKCTKFLYSSPSVKQGKAYQIKANGISSEKADTTWSGKICKIKVESKQNR